MKQLNIELKGVQFSNKGAELMLLAVLKMLEDSSLNYSLTLSPGSNLPYFKRAKLGAWQKLSFRRGGIDLTGLFAFFPNKLKAFLKNYGIITEDAIDIVFDLSGFAYGDQWGEKELRNTKKQVLRFSKRGKLYIFFPQAFGPFKLKENRTNMLSIIENASLMFARDQSSYGYLNDVLSASTISLNPDFTCLVNTRNNQYSNLLEPGRRNMCLIPNSKLISKYNNSEKVSNLKDIVRYYVAIINVFLEKNWHVIVMNHEGKEDLAICNLIMNQVSGSVSLISEISAEGTKELIKSMDAVISSRYHGCISSLTQNIPCLATSWSHKYEQLFEDYNLNNNILSTDINERELEERVSSFIYDLDEQKKQLPSISDCYYKSSLAMFEQIEKHINKHFSKIG